VERLGPSGFVGCGGDAAPLPHAPSALFSVADFVWMQGCRFAGLIGYDAGMHSKWTPNSNLAAMVGRNYGCVPMIGVFGVTLLSSFLLFRFSRNLYVICAYGWAAWDAGLQITGKNGHLSNGTSISDSGQIITQGGGFLMTAAVAVGSLIGFAYFLMRLKGERFGEQLERWRKSRISN